jgi:carbonic anhydrase
MHPLLQRNQAWAAGVHAEDPSFFEKAAAVHAPHTLYIGCCDARVPADVVTDTQIGEMFVHRNIANQVQPADPSLGATLQYAVEVLGVTDIVVCGHQECGGVRAALTGQAPSSVDGWLNPLRLLARVHSAELEALPESERLDRLVHLNVREQVDTLSRHPVVKAAWAAGRPLVVHGWVYTLRNGHLHEVVRKDVPQEIAAAK